MALLATSAGEVRSGGLPGTFLSRNNPVTRAVGLLAGWQPVLVEGVSRTGHTLIWTLTRRFAYGDRRIDPARVDLVNSMISANAVDALTDFVDTLERVLEEAPDFAEPGTVEDVLAAESWARAHAQEIIAGSVEGA